MNNLLDEGKKVSSTVLKYVLEYDSFFDKIKINNKIEFNYLIFQYVDTINTNLFLYKRDRFNLSSAEVNRQNHSKWKYEDILLSLNTNMHNFLMLNNKDLIDKINYDIDSSYQAIIEKYNINKDIETELRSDLSMIRVDDREDDIQQKLEKVTEFSEELYKLYKLLMQYIELIQKSIEDQNAELAEGEMNSLKKSIQEQTYVLERIKKKILFNFLFNKLYIGLSLLVVLTSSGVIYYYFDTIKLFFKEIQSNNKIK